MVSRTECFVTGSGGNVTVPSLEHADAVPRTDWPAWPCMTAAPPGRSAGAYVACAPPCAALDKLASVVRPAEEARILRARAFENALAHWRTWCSGHSWLASVIELEVDALRQCREVGDRCDAWDRSWSEAAWQLRQCLTGIARPLRYYQPLLASRAAPEE